jgi:hypothetical protein
METSRAKSFDHGERHEGTTRIIRQALASAPGTRVRLEPLGHRTSRRNDIQVLTLLGSQATGPANAEYDLAVVSLASKKARSTSLPEQDNPSRLVNDRCSDRRIYLAFGWSSSCQKLLHLHWGFRSWEQRRPHHQPPGARPKPIPACQQVP